MPTKLIALPCSASELEAALHKVCDHGGHWANRIHVCLYKPENRYALELHDEAFDGQRSTQDGAALSCGDAAAMRAALVAMVKAETDGSMEREDLCGRCLSKLFDECKHDGSCWVDRVMAAISKPPRNCDVGTADEQSERFRAFCHSHMYGFNDPRGYRCKEDCPVKMEIVRRDKLCIYCQLVWAQMPYEEGQR